MSLFFIFYSISRYNLANRLDFVHILDLVNRLNLVNKRGLTIMFTKSSLRCTMTAALNDELKGCAKKSSPFAFKRSGTLANLRNTTADD